MLVLPIFQTVKPNNAPPEAYKLRLDYKHPCGPYEMLCPLPQDHAQQLKAIAAKLERPQWCDRYAGLRSP